MIKLYKALLIISCSMIVTGCPASVTYLSLKNTSTQPIAVVYEDVYKSVININETKKENVGNCISIRSGNKIYDYNLTRMFPEGYISSKISSIEMNAVFTNDHRLKVYDKNNPNDFIELDNVCPY